MLQSAMVNTPNSLAHTQPECYFNFRLPPMLSAAGLWASPPCCILSVMFSRRQSSLSNLSHPAPRLFLAQDTFCITADVTGTTCHSRAHLCSSAPPNHPASRSRCHLPASSAQGLLERETMTWGGEKEAAYVCCYSQSRRREDEHPVFWHRNPGRDYSEEKKAAKE